MHPSSSQIIRYHISSRLLASRRADTHHKNRNRTQIFGRERPCQCLTMTMLSCGIKKKQKLSIKMELSLLVAVETRKYIGGTAKQVKVAGRQPIHNG